MSPLKSLFVITSIITLFFTGTAISSETNKNNELTSAIQKNKKHIKGEVKSLLKLTKKSYPKTNLNQELYHNWIEQLVIQIDPNNLYLSSEDIKKVKESYSPDIFKKYDINPVIALYEKWENSANRIQNNLEKNLFTISSDKPKAKKITPEIFDTYIGRRWTKLISKQNFLLPEGSENLLLDTYKNSIRSNKELIETNSSQHIVSALIKAFDKNADYFSKLKLNDFKEELDLVGLGFSISFKNDLIQISKVISSGPADNTSKIQAGDYILAIRENNEYTPLTLTSLEHNTKLLRGKKNSKISLLILRGQVSSWIQLTRDTAPLSTSEITYKAIKQQNHIFGIIKIPSFYMDFEAYQKRDINFKSCSRDLNNALKDLKKQKVDGIVIDLRNNRGGSLFEGSSALDTILKPGPTLQNQDIESQKVRRFNTRSVETYKGPLIVLTNENSAGSAEIFAAAVQDYNRGVIIGSATYGMGYVYTLPSLPNGRAKIASDKLFRVSGRPFAEIGVIPDILLGSQRPPQEQKAGIATLKINTYSQTYQIRELQDVAHSPKLNNIKSTAVADTEVLVAFTVLEAMMFSEKKPAEDNSK